MAGDPERPDDTIDSAVLLAPEAEPAAELSVGEKLADRYVIVEKLGAGGFGAVYRARDEEAGGTVAIKVLRVQASFSSDVEARFRQEARVARELSHPNIVQVWDFGVTPLGDLFAVMELVEGQTLDDLLYYEGALPLDRVRHIARQLLRALAEAHANGVIHRDLKPANIMLCEGEGEPEHVKVLDFGIAKVLSEERALVSTLTGTVVGTLGYASPEALMGKHVTRAADVYAMGLILAEMLTGDPIFDGDTIGEFITLQWGFDADSVEIPAHAQQYGPLIRKALEGQPEKRFADAAEMLTALESVESGGFPQVAADAASPRAERDREKATAQTVAESDAQRKRDDEKINLGTADTMAGETPAATAPDQRKWTGGSFFSEEFGARPTPPQPDESKSKLGLWFVAVAVLALLAALALYLPGRDSTDTPQEAASPPPPPVTEPEPEPEPEPPAVEAEPEPEIIPLPSLPGESVDSLSWDWLTATAAEPIEPARVLQRRRSRARTAEAEVPVSAQRLQLESLGLRQEARGMLRAALGSDGVPSGERAAALTRYADLTDAAISGLVELGRCEQAGSELTALASDALVDEALRERMSEVVAGCTAIEVAAVPWDPEAFLGHLADADAAYETATAIPATDPAGVESRTPHLESALRNYQAARDLLTAVVSSEETPAGHRAQMQSQLHWLDGRIVAVQVAMNRCEAAAFHMASTGSAATGEASATGAMVNQCRTRVAATGGGVLDWSKLDAMLAKVALLEQQAEVLLAAQQPEPEPSLFTRRVDITSQPVGARISVDGDTLGRTPFEGEVSSESPTVTVTLRLAEHDTERLRIELTDEGEYRRTVRLEADEPEQRREHDVNPFGRVRPWNED